MLKNSKNILLAMMGIMAVLMVASCEEELNEMDLAGVHPNFETSKSTFKVYARNKQLTAVQTNGLSLYQLGKYTHPVYGEERSYLVSQVALSSYDPRFGTYSQESEDAEDDYVYTDNELETVTRVYLDIPFFSSVKVEDDSPVLDDDDQYTYELDSIFGNEEATFDLSVKELTYYLGDYDEDSNFTESAVYYSSDTNLDLAAYAGASLATETGYELSSETIKIMEEDDPDTEDVDESDPEEGTIAEVLTPRMQIDLDTEFFQTKILDAEGSNQLENANNFKNYFRGIMIETSNFSDDLLMLLDLSEAKIVIEYSYSSYSENDDEEVEIDDTNTSEFEISLSGNKIQRTTTTNFPTLPTTNDAASLYVKGGQGSMVELSLFNDNFDIDADDIVASEEIAQMQEEEWLINEANLTFYIDHDQLGTETKEPPRVYLVDLDEESGALIDYSYDNTTSTTYNKYILGGIIEEDDDGVSTRYKIRLTEHLNNIVRNDSINTRLGLFITADIGTVSTVAAKDGEGTKSKIPSASVTTPLGTVLYGSSEDVPEEQRVQLEVFYTKPSN